MSFERRSSENGYNKILSLPCCSGCKRFYIIYSLLNRFSEGREEKDSQGRYLAEKGETQSQNLYVLVTQRKDTLNKEITNDCRKYQCFVSHQALSLVPPVPV